MKITESEFQALLRAHELESIAFLKEMVDGDGKSPDPTLPLREALKHIAVYVVPDEASP